MAMLEERAANCGCTVPAAAACVQKGYFGSAVSGMTYQELMDPKTPEVFCVYLKYIS